jgi:hypothetical protein
MNYNDKYHTLVCQSCFFGKKHAFLACWELRVWYLDIPFGELSAGSTYNRDVGL